MCGCYRAGDLCGFSGVHGRGRPRVEPRRSRTQCWLQSRESRGSSQVCFWGLSRTASGADIGWPAARSGILVKRFSVCLEVGGAVEGEDLLQTARFPLRLFRLKRETSGTLADEMQAGSYGRLCISVWQGMVRMRVTYTRARIAANHELRCVDVATCVMLLTGLLCRRVGWACDSDRALAWRCRRRRAGAMDAAASREPTRPSAIASPRVGRWADSAIRCIGWAT